MISKRHLLFSFFVWTLVANAITPGNTLKDANPILPVLGDNVKIDMPNSSRTTILPANVPLYSNGQSIYKPETIKVNTNDIQTVPITVNVLCNQNSFWPLPFLLDLACCAEDGYLDWYYFDYDMENQDDSNPEYILSTQAELPVTGGYVILLSSSSFWNKAGDLLLVEYVSDPTMQNEITFDPESATRNFTWKMVDDEGNTLSLSKGHLDEDQMNWIISEPGNTSSVDLSKTFYFDDTLICIYGNTAYITYDDTPYSTENYSIWTNYCGDKLWMTFDMATESNEKVYWAYGNAPFGEETSFSNNPSTYHHFNLEIASEPYSTEEEERYRLVFSTMLQDQCATTILQSFYSPDKIYLGNFHESYRKLDNAIALGKCQNVFTTEWGSLVPAFTVCPHYFFDEDIYLPTPIYTNFGSVSKGLLPTSPLLAFESGDMTALFGEGPAVTTSSLYFIPYWADPEIKQGYVSFNSYGLMGEVREADRYFMQYSASFDGEEIFKNIDINALSSELQNWCMTRPGNGLLSLKAVNNNQTLDQTPVTTTGEYLINYGSQDVWAPTVLLMNLRDSSNRIGYNLSTAVGAKAVIGAVASQLDLATYEYNFSPVDVEVEYVQHGNDDWTVLPTETSEEPGVGTLAVTSLSEIGEDAKGLYDLRITVTSEDGNKFIETVSPAFRIIGESSIESVTDPQQGTPTIYNLQGVQVTTTTPGLNILVYPDGTVRKLILR